MKRFTLITIVWLMPLITVVAQSGLSIAPYFDGRYNKSKDVVSLNLKGSTLHTYHLMLYRSLTFKKSTPDIEHAILNDAKLAIDKETAHRDGRLLYGFYCLPPTSDKAPLRYIFYRRTANQTILAYLEGTATLDALKHMFK